MEGIILWFNQFKGYGEIETEDGDRYFFTPEDTSDLELTDLKSEKKVRFVSSNDVLFGWPRASKVTHLERRIKRGKHKEAVRL